MDPFPFPTPSISSAYTPDTMATNPPRNLQDHLYTSFLEGSTADVALHVSGSWYAVYKLHRVILIQAVSFVHLPYLCRRAEPTYPAAIGVLQTPLYRGFLRISLPPETIALRRS